MRIVRLSKTHEDECIPSPKVQDSKLEIFIEVQILFQNDVTFFTKVSETMTAIELLEKCASFINLKVFFDFKLFALVEDEDLMLQDDEFVFKTLENNKNNQSNCKIF